MFDEKNVDKIVDFQIAIMIVLVIMMFFTGVYVLFTKLF